jgi:hypothetical protein
MWEYICFNKKENKEITLYGYNFKNALKRAGISELYAYNNLRCVVKTYID